jgi:hypothetical protein
MVPTYDSVHEEAVLILSCPTIWDGQALCVVSFVFFDCRERGCITKMRKELELETLEERRQSLRLILMYKVVEGLSHSVSVKGK